MGLRKVFSGKFECGECGQQYDAQGVKEDELFCVDCEDEPLVEVEEKEKEEEEGDEEEED